MEEDLKENVMAKKDTIKENQSFTELLEEPASLVEREILKHKPAMIAICSYKKIKMPQKSVCPFKSK